MTGLAHWLLLNPRRVFPLLVAMTLPAVWLLLRRVVGR